MEIIFKLTKEQLEEVNRSFYRKFTGRYYISLLNGETLYGAHLKRDLQKALKPQKVDVVYDKF